MSTLIAYADGNLTGASTFKVAETGSGALTMIRNSTATIGQNGSVTSPAFTITNGAVIDGVLLWLVNNTSGIAGTLTVELDKSGVSQASVTVNQTDLPHSNSGSNDVVQYLPVFFKFTSTATGDGTANWTLKLTNSNSGGASVNYARNSGTAGDYTKALRTSTTAAPAAADDLYIVGELTGAGTHNSRTVTMDSTASTAYGNGSVNSTSVNGGGVRISCYATLTYGTSASTAYVLRVNGDVEVFWNGTLNIGASGTEIPRSSTAVLEMQMASATGDFGLQVHNLATCNIAGLSRTVGKNVVKAKLTADVVSTSALIGNASATNLSGLNNGGIDATGISSQALSILDNSTSGNHTVQWPCGSNITAVTQTVTFWIAGGTGTNNRYVRAFVGSSSSFSGSTNGFYSDLDLQAGTAGTVTAQGNGTATSVSITPVGLGYVVRMTGKASSAQCSPWFYLAACSAAGTTSYAGNSTQNFTVDHVNVVNAASVSDTTWSIDTNTGWLSGDAVCVAATTRTIYDGEDTVLNTNAGASSFTTALCAFGHGNQQFGGNIAIGGTHSGTVPTQGEVGLLTRNVRIRSTSPTLWSYVYFEPLATVTASWAEFYYHGLNTPPKRGIETKDNPTTNPRNITYCSIHDVYNVLLLNVANNTSLGVTFSNNIVWNTSSHAVQFSGSTVGTDWTFDSNLLIRPGGSGFLLSDVGGVCTNNTVVAAAGNPGFNLNESSVIGTFNNNTAHSGGSTGLTMGQTPTGLVSNFTAWRNNNYGINHGSFWQDLELNNLLLFGNTNGNILANNVNEGPLLTGTNILAGETAYTSNYGINFSPSGLLGVLDINNVDFSGSTSIYSIFAPHATADLLISTSFEVCLRGTVNNCKFGAPAVINSKAFFSKTSYVSFEKFNQVAGDHRTEMAYGQIRTDSVLYNKAAPSMRMTPNSASSKLESAPKYKGMLVACQNGYGVTVSVWVRKSQSSDGAAYNGNQPRLIQRANGAMGQITDVVLATMGAAVGTWQQLTGTTYRAATDNGVWEFIIDCDGTQGWINVDDWSATSGVWVRASSRFMLSASRAGLGSTVVMDDRSGKTRNIVNVGTVT